MSVLAITGATGFVGAALLDTALAAGHRVRALTRRGQPPRAGIAWIGGDLADAAALRALVQGADAVIHVAGVVNAPDAAAFEAGNVTGTAALADAMRGAGAGANAGGRVEGRAGPLVHVSSLAAREPGLSAYGASKARAEDVVRAAGVDWRIVRPPAIYGPRDTELFELFRIARLGIVPLPPRGRTSLIHVADLAALLVALACDPGGGGVLYEADDGREGGWSHEDMARAIGRAVGRAQVRAVHLPRALLRAAARADRALRGDGAKLTPDRVGYMTHPDWVVRPSLRPPAALWAPRIAMAEGMIATARWYREAGWL